MNQILHIFRKDVRGQRWQIALALAMTAAFAWLRDSRATAIVYMLLPVAWWALIAAAVYEESLPGDKQFWVTRPYRWKSLLAAKALLILAFVNLPLLLADGVIFANAGFNPAAHLPGLLWRQTFITAMFLLPVAALAALTRSLGQFALAALGVVVFSVAAGGLPSHEAWVGLVWVRTAWFVVMVVVTAVVVLLAQYRTRRTAVVCGVVVVALVALQASLSWFPWNAAYAVQAWIDEVTPERFPITVALDRPAALGLFGGNVRTPPVYLKLPLRIAQTPRDMETVIGDVHVTLRTAQGQTWKDSRELNEPVPASGVVIVQGLGVYPGFATQTLSQPVRLHLALAATIYRNERTVEVTVGRERFPAPGIGYCWVSESGDQVVCQSPLRGPDRAAVVADGGWSGAMLRHPSPFPMDLDLAPVSTNVLTSSPGVFRPGTKLRFTAQRAVAHIRREVEVENVRLTDYATSWN